MHICRLLYSSTRDMIVNVNRVKGNSPHVVRWDAKKKSMLPRAIGQNLMDDLDNHSRGKRDERREFGHVEASAISFGTSSAVLGDPTNEKHTFSPVPTVAVNLHFYMLRSRKDAAKTLDRLQRARDRGLHFYSSKLCS